MEAFRLAHWKIRTCNHPQVIGSDGKASRGEIKGSSGCASLLGLSSLFVRVEKRKLKSASYRPRLRNSLNVSFFFQMTDALLPQGFCRVKAHWVNMYLPLVPTHLLS